MTQRVIVAAAGAGWEYDAVRLLTGSLDGLELARRCVDVSDLVAVAATGQADVALVATELHGLDADAVRRLQDAGVTCVAVGTDSSARMRRLGIDRVVGADLDGLAATLLAVAPAASAQDFVGTPTGADVKPAVPTSAGRLVAVWGPTGAPGRSTVALGLAAESAALDRPTVLLDVDVYGGSVAPMLAMLDEVSGVLAAARLANTGSLDQPKLTELLRSVSTNLHVLTGFPRADRWPQLRPGALAAVLEVARETADVVVVDCGFCLESDEDLSFDTAAPRRNGATLQVLEAADLVLAVGSADPVGIARLARGVLDLGDLLPSADVRIVMNRVRSGLGWSTDEVAETVHRFTGRRPVAFLPEDITARDRAAITGQTLIEIAPSSRLRRELHALAAGLLSSRTTAAVR